jgi:DnaJ-class molecular chaperone
VKTIKELGMPFYEQPHKFGNLYLKIVVVFPDKLESADKEKLFNILSEQNKPEIVSDTNEKYFLTDIVKGEENTHHSGGKVEERRHGEH